MPMVVIDEKKLEEMRAAADELAARANRIRDQVAILERGGMSLGSITVALTEEQLLAVADEYELTAADAVTSAEDLPSTKIVAPEPIEPDPEPIP